MNVSAALLLLASILPAQAGQKLHFDLRGDKPLPAELKLAGMPEAATLITREDAGMRVTVPAGRKSNYPIGVRLKPEVSGDFVITGKFDLFSAEVPKGTYAVGVAFNLGPDDGVKRFAKLGRFVRPGGGDAFIAEWWNRDPPKQQGNKILKTEATAGRLRIVRKGSTLHFQVAEGLDGEFQEMCTWDYGADDLGMVRFGVNNNASEAAVEARLIELDIESIGEAAEAPPPVPQAPITRFARLGALWGAVAVVIVALFGGLAYWQARRRKAMARRE